MKEKYSSKEQEAFFKPWRIQVVVHAPHRNTNKYAVIIRDTAQQGEKGVKYTWIHKVLVKDEKGHNRAKKLGCWDYETPDGYEEQPDTQWFHAWNVITKAAAIEIAKAQAVRLSLPFDLQRDVVEYVEITRGKEIACFVCGKNPKRSFEPFVCSGCQLLLETGRKAIQETQECAIYSEDLLRYGLVDQRVDVRGLSQKLANSLSQIARVQIGDQIGPFGKQSDFIVRREGDGGFNRERRYQISLGQEQAEAMTTVVNFVNEVMGLAYTHGFDVGKSLLLGLASGDLSISELEDQEIKKARRQQVHN